MKPTSRQRPTIRVGSFVAAACLPLLGCGPAPVPTGNVSGQFTLGGKAVGKVIVSFTPSAGTPVSAVTDDAGRYEVKGVPVGEAIVVVAPAPESQEDEPARPSRDAGPTTRPPRRGGPSTGPAANIPPEFRDIQTSKLRFKVETGENKYDIPLK